MSKSKSKLQKTIKGQKYRFIESNIVNNDINNNKELLDKDANSTKIDTLRDYLNKDMFLTEIEEAEIKNNIKKISKSEIQDVLKLKNDNTLKADTELENKNVYERIVKDAEKYQEIATKQNNADTIDYRDAQSNYKKKYNTIKSIINNNSNSSNTKTLFKDINSILVKNNLDTDKNTLELENKELLQSVNSEVIKRRYQDLKKMRSLIYQNEIRNMHRNKIKSKLYHKIQKKQKLKQEAELLKQLQEVDPKAVQEYLEKQKDKRIDERISLKHTFNKFNSTIKKYNLKHDSNVKESMLENYRKRDKLMEKAKNPDVDCSDDYYCSDSNNLSINDLDEDNLEEHDLNDNNTNTKDNHNDENYISNKKNDKNNIYNDLKYDPKKILINFNEDKVKTTTNNDKQKSGVFAMSFMNNNNSIKNKLDDLINEEELDDNTNKDSLKIINNSVKNRVNENAKSKCNLDVNIQKEKTIINNSSSNNYQNDKCINQNNFISNKFMKDIKDEDHDKSKYNKLELDLDEDQMNKIISQENLKDNTDFLKTFVLNTNENKENFIKDTYNELLNNNKTEYMQGWGTWTGQSKAVKAKEFLIKKRIKEIEEKKAMKEFSNIKNKLVKVSNIEDKKFNNNYLIKELPHPYTSINQYEKDNCTPIGPEWNTLNMFKQINQPKVVKFIGKVIGNIGQIDKNSIKTQKLNEIIEKHSKKIVRTKSKI